MLPAQSDGAKRRMANEREFSTTPYSISLPVTEHARTPHPIPGISRRTYSAAALYQCPVQCPLYDQQYIVLHFSTAHCIFAVSGTPLTDQ